MIYNYNINEVSHFNFNLEEMSMRTTIKDVAEEAGVSISTVSMVMSGKADRISEQTKKRVLEVAERLDYVPNRQAQWLQSQESKVLAILVPDLSNNYYARLASAAMQTAMSNGYLLIVLTLPEDADEQKNLRTIFRGGYIGGVLIASRRFDSIRKDLVGNKQISYVLMDESIAESDSRYLVTGDKELGGQIAARHFLEMGHRKFACITGPEGAPNSVRRLEGFVGELKRNGIEIPEENIYRGDYDAKSGYEGAAALEGKDFTAVFAFNDLSAIGAMRYFQERGYRIPEDVSIIGYDHIQTSDYVYPRLTTVDQNLNTIAVAGTEALINLITGKPVLSEQLIAPTLIAGETVARIGKSLYGDK